MAFTSKVVILLLVLSLAWWQASAEGASTKTIIESTLNNITMMTNALTTKVNETIFNSNNHQELLKGLKGIVNAFVLGNDRLKTVSDRISDGATVVKAVEMLVVAQEKLLKGVETKLLPKSAYLALRKLVAPDLVELSKVAQDYEKNLKKLLLMKSQIDDVGKLFRKLLTAFLVAVAKLVTP